MLFPSHICHFKSSYLYRFKLAKRTALWRTLESHLGGHQWNLTHFGQIFGLRSSFPWQLSPTTSRSSLLWRVMTALLWCCQIVSSAWFGSQLVCILGARSSAWVELQRQCWFMCQCSLNYPAMSLALRLDSIWHLHMNSSWECQDLWLLNGLA